MCRRLRTWLGFPIRFVPMTGEHDAVGERIDIDDQIDTCRFDRTNRVPLIPTFDRVACLAVYLWWGWPWCLPSLWSESLGHMFFHWKFCGLRSRWRRRRDKNGTGGHICKTCSRRHIDNDRGETGSKVVWSLHLKKCSNAADRRKRAKNKYTWGVSKIHVYQKTDICTEFIKHK